MFCESCGNPIKKQADICPECGVRNGRSGGPRTAAGGGAKPTAEPSGRLAAAGIGGVAAFFLSFLPLIGQIGGGVIAGYLRGSDTRESTITGAYAGGIASIPVVAIYGLLLFFGSAGVASEGAGAGGSLVVGSVALLFLAGFYVVLGAGGGAIGASVTNRAKP